MKGCGKPCNCPSYRDHLLSVSVAPSAMPSRSPEVAATKARDGRWQKDMPAYKRLRKDGVQPKSIDGAADIEKRATVKAEVESGQVVQRPKHLEKVMSELGQ